MALTNQDKNALDALQKEKLNSGSSYNKTEVWCVAGIFDSTGGVIRISSCHRFGPTGGGNTPNWFWDVKDINKKCATDSECKAFNDLENPREPVIGTEHRLVMLGYYGPCGSCKKVIREFRTHYRIPATIFYHEYMAKGADSLWPNGTDYGWKAGDLQDLTKDNGIWVARFE